MVRHEKARRIVVLANDRVVHEWHAPTGVHSSSFHSEGVALAEALRWLTTTTWAAATIVCDCKSLVAAVSNPYPTDAAIIDLQKTAADLAVDKQLSIIWVPGHCNLFGNELADAQAKLGSAIPGGNTSRGRQKIPAADYVVRRRNLRNISGCDVRHCSLNDTNARLANL